MVGLPDSGGHGFGRRRNYGILRFGGHLRQDAECQQNGGLQGTMVKLGGPHHAMMQARSGGCNRIGILSCKIRWKYELHASHTGAIGTTRLLHSVTSGNGIYSQTHGYAIPLIIGASNQAFEIRRN
ncbi:hypothetical protein FHS61_002803 [Altererythrobacter atlanticus]|uniref:hypothetical protein n=1 Tax=Croceibacterium atlanticum TaxID=1267766 RepID=UPI0012E172FB|nr:hypothetical protein [Croceibacterium atlanticum]MBB5733760.1 hypothetical protein [Croceibacterium atlanticum]